MSTCLGGLLSLDAENVGMGGTGAQALASFKPFNRLDSGDLIGVLCMLCTDIGVGFDGLALGHAVRLALGKLLGGVAGGPAFSATGCGSVWLLAGVA